MRPVAALSSSPDTLCEGFERNQGAANPDWHQNMSYMLTNSLLRSFCLLALSFGLCACGSSSSGPNSPTPPSGGALTAPVPMSPVNNEQLSTLKPTLVVQNTTTAAQAGRTYDFQISDRADFTAGGVAINQTGVPEGGDGRTRFTPSEDLQPTTRLFWRSRVVQGSSTSDWSQPATFKTKLVGYSRPGELYDPLIHGETIGTIQGSHTWIPGGAFN